VDTDKILLEEANKNSDLIEDNNERESLTTLQAYYNKAQGYSKE
jgi:hypothetical protein